MQVVVEVDDTFRHNSLNSMDHRIEQELVDSMACTRVDGRGQELDVYMGRHEHEEGGEDEVAGVRADEDDWHKEDDHRRHDDLDDHHLHLFFFVCDDPNQDQSHRRSDHHRNHCAVRKAMRKHEFQFCLMHPCMRKEEIADSLHAELLIACMQVLVEAFDYHA